MNMSGNLKRRGLPDRTEWVSGRSIACGTGIRLMEWGCGTVGVGGGGEREEKESQGMPKMPEKPGSLKGT